MSSPVEQFWDEWELEKEYEKLCNVISILKNDPGVVENYPWIKKLSFLDSDAIKADARKRAATVNKNTKMRIHESFVRLQPNALTTEQSRQLQKLAESKGY